MYGGADSFGRSPERWYKELPPLTRFVLTVTFVLTLSATFGLFNPRLIILDWSLVLKKFHFWRLVTDYFFAGAFGIGWIMHVYFLVTFSSKLEVNEMFTASPGAYLYFLLFQCLLIDLLSLVLFWPTGKPIMAQAMTLAIIYYWSRREPYSPIGIWGFQIQAYQFPFALLFLDLLIGNSLWTGAIGLTTGHIYYFIKDLLPAERGISLLDKTPRICDEIMIRASYFDLHNVVGSLKVLLFGVPSLPPRTFRAPASNASNLPPETEPRLFSGSGHRLGSN